MDSLHVSSHHHHQQANNSKTSSRSTSPCRPKSGEHHHHHAPHHAKTLSHGSADSYKSQDGVTSSSSTTQQQQHQHQQQLQHQFSSSHHHRHRSPTSNTNNTSNSNNNSSSSNTRGGGVSVVGGDMDDSTHLLSSSSHHRGGVGTDNLDDTGLLEGSGVADSSDYYHSSLISNGSSEHVKQAEDEGDGINARTTAVLETLGNKISRVKDLIKTEQKLRDDNVNEYLKLAANADKQQVQRIKAVFEKKNQKSAQVISQLQKKLDNYQKRVIELETHGVSHRPPREVLRDMGQGLKNVGGNIRDGITGFGGSVMSKPKEFAHLIKNKFGSVDNISQLSTWYIGPGTTGSEGSGTGNGGAGSDQGEKSHHHHGSATLPAMLHSTTSQNSMGQQQAAKFPSDEGSECSSVTSESIERYHGRGQESSSHGESFSLKAIIKQLQDTNEEVSRLREKTEASKSLHQEIQDLHSSLQEEKFRNERLEEQINDLTELHQNEVENLKQALADMEEKVQYQSEERLRDIQDMLDHCQTKIQKMEHQALQQQQYVTLEGLDNSNARALVVKLINVLLTVLQVILLLVATVSGIIMPFLRTRDDNCSRSVTTIHENYSEADGSWWKMPNGGKLLMSSLLPSSFYTAQASTRHSFMSSHSSSSSAAVAASTDATAHAKS